MKYCIVETSTGRIGPFGLTQDQRTLDRKTRNIGPDWEVRTDPPEGIDPRVTYFDGTDYVARPVTPEPSATYDLTQLPSGTTVYVRNEAGDELTIVDLTEALTLTDPGTYTFHVLPPFPYQEIKTELEVD